MRVFDLMTVTTHTLPPSATCEEAWSAMSRWQIHHLPIVDSEGRPLGVVSHRDLAELRAPGRRHALVADVMSTQVITASPTLSIKEAAKRMRGASIGCLVVTDNGKLTGIITTTDLLRWIDSNGGRVEPAEHWRQLRSSARYPRAPRLH